MTFEIPWITLLLYACAVSALPLSQYDVIKHKEAKKPYSFSYGIKDDYRGTNFERREESDGSTVTGSYSVQLPDGRKQTVKYEADHQKGFVAEVSYYGEAKYPLPSKEPPFVVRVVGHKFAENAHRSPHLIPKTIGIQEVKSLFPRPIHDSKGFLQSVEDPEFTEAVHHEPKRQEYPLRPRPVFQQHIHHNPFSEKHFSEFDAHISYQDPRIGFLPNPVLSEEDDITFHRTALPFPNQFIIQKNKLEIGDESKEDNFLDETDELMPFHTRFGLDYRGIPLQLLRRNPLHLEDTDSKLYIPRYASSVLSKAFLRLGGDAPFNYGDVRIGHSPYPLRLHESHMNSQFLRPSPLLVTSQEHHHGDKEATHSDEQDEKPLDALDASVVGDSHFLADAPRHLNLVSHPEKPSNFPPVYIPTESKKPISREKPLHQSQGFRMEEEDPTFEENSSVSGEASDDLSKGEAPSKW